MIEQAVFQNLARFSYSDTRSLEKLSALSHDVSRRGVAGDIVECGVYTGGSAGALAYLTEKHRTVWLYDSFEGLPAPDERDGPDASPHTGKCRGDESTAVSTVRATGFEGRVVTRPGWFKDTFLLPRGPTQIAILHIDADWYEGTYDSLHRFYQYVSPGGIIILDDFGHWEGCRRAFYKYCCTHDLAPVLGRTTAISEASGNCHENSHPHHGGKEAVSHSQRLDVAGHWPLPQDGICAVDSPTPRE